jgi:hypothetical protein
MICGVQVLSNISDVLRFINPPGCKQPLLRRMGNFHINAPDTGMFFTDVSEGAVRNVQMQNKARELQEKFLSTVDMIYYCAGGNQIKTLLEDALRATPSSNLGVKSGDAAPSSDSGDKRGLADVSDHDDDTATESGARKRSAQIEEDERSSKKKK